MIYRENKMKTKKLIRAFALLLSIAVFNIGLFSKNVQAAYSWIQVGSPGFTASGETTEFTSIAFHPSTGEPYVAYRETTNSYKANVMRYHNSAWEQVGAANFSDGPAAFVDLTFSVETEEPYITYADSGITLAPQKTTVKKFNGSSWVNVGDPMFSTGIAAYNVIGINPSDDVPYVAYADATTSKIYVKKFNGSTWTDVGAPGFSTGNATYVSLSFDPAINQPAVAYYDSTTGKAEVKFFNGVSWSDYGVSPSAGQAFYTSLAFDSENYPYVAYQDGTDGNKLVIKEFIEGAWIKAIPDSPPGLSDGEATYIALTSRSGILYVAYKDAAHSNKITAKMIASNQITAIGTGISAGQADYSAIAVNPISGEPFISYVDVANDSRVSVIKYANIISTPIYRLYNTLNGAYLYTRGDADKAHVLNTWPEFEFTDGVPAFYASLTDNGLTPIYRLYNTLNGMYLYTRGDADKAHVLNTWPEFEFTDGVPAFYASLE